MSTINQFANFSNTFYYPVDYTDSPANTEYVDVLFNGFKDPSLNIAIVSNTVTVTKTIEPRNFGTEETPDIRDAFKFVISGSFGEELATQDNYVYRRGSEVITTNSYNQLPNFNEPSTYLIEFSPDSRHGVNVATSFTTNATPANTFVAWTQEFILQPARHISRVTSISQTIAARAEVEKQNKITEITRRVNSIVPNYPGKQS